MGEVFSRGMLAVSGTGNDSRLLPEHGACMLFVHPVHGQEMHAMHAELQALRGTSSEGSASMVNETAAKRSCDWPEEVHVKGDGNWEAYMKRNFRGRIDCWMAEFTWQTCCNTRLWGAGGN